MKHTPGPWLYLLERQEVEKDFVLMFHTVRNGDGNIVRVRTEADARLIAAAPELKDVVIEGYELSRYAAASKGCNTNEFLEGLKERIELYQFACKQVIERATGQNIKEILQEARP